VGAHQGKPLLRLRIRDYLDGNASTLPNGRSGVAPYMQLIHQVRQALRLGLLREGDKLPTVKDVAANLAIIHRGAVRQHFSVRK
jgi:hypothetical protein